MSLLPGSRPITRDLAGSARRALFALTLAAASPAIASDADNDGLPDDVDPCPNTPQVEILERGTLYPSIAAAVADAMPSETLRLAVCLLEESGIVIDKTLTIEGGGPESTFIDAAGDGPIFLVNNASLTLGLVTLQNASGGAIVATGQGSVSVWICEFVDNDGADAPASVVSASSAGPGARSIEMSECIFRGNTGGTQGMIVASGNASVRMTSCLAYDNTGPRLGSAAGNSHLTLASCTLTDGLGCETLDAASAVTLLNNVMTTPAPVVGPGAHTVHRTTYPGATGNNIDGMPIFEDPASNDYRLAAGSPGIDAADFIVYTGDVTLDLFGVDRTSNDGGTPDTGIGFIRHLDCGAFEFQGCTTTPTPTAACCLPRDGCLDLPEDVCLTLSGFWNSGVDCTVVRCSGCPGDLNGDGTTDVFDFADFAIDFGCGS